MKKYSMCCIVLILLFSFCTDKTRIDYQKMQGLYQYLIINSESGAVVDSLFSTVKILNAANQDTLKIQIDIIGVVFGTNDKIQKVWLKKSKIKFIPLYYQIYSLDISSGETWSLNEIVDIEPGTFNVKFFCLSNDTTISIDSDKTLQHITLIEQRDWIDVGGFWDIVQYGFEKINHKVVYLKKFILNPRNKTINEKCNLLVLDKFINIKNQSCTDYENWISRNSSESKKWFYDHDVIKDIPPPPESPLE